MPMAIESGAKPAHFGLYTPDIPALAARLCALHMSAEADEGLLGFPPGSRLHPLFFGGRNKSPTDGPEHFAHSNSATRHRDRKSTCPTGRPFRHVLRIPFSMSALAISRQGRTRIGRSADANRVSKGCYPRGAHWASVFHPCSHHSVACTIRAEKPFSRPS